MELTKKTTILLSPALHTRLMELSSARGVSMGELIRQACEQTYGDQALERRREAFRRLTSLNLPVGTVEEMERQSVPAPEDICPDPV